ncbi:glycosyltransferase [Methanosarcina sp. KYL-1]|uniref:glycosyltransferase family 2 protein n=1 Tax=Methanosarcina sp. KYL-1 TaxID=2602068 RepID=UPI002100EB86|nr:glycosyltransferase [Methanosarcina sp. KYL-1]MCQ1535115.1 glycosyltransferase [Methanosarcina sp. KYL-1]
MSSALAIGLHSLISDPINIVSSSSQLSDRLIRHELTVVIPAFNEESSIGSEVLLAASYADRVLVLDRGSTDRTMEVAALGGARVVPLNGGEEALLKSLYRASLDSELVALIYPECMQDIDLLSHVLEPLRQGGCELSVGSWPCRLSCELENVMLLNGKKTTRDNVGFLAVTAASLQKLSSGQENLSLKALLSAAKAENLKINYMSFEADPLFRKLESCRIGVVVPAYNEELLIGDTLKGIPEYVDRIYVIDDGSTDRTGEVVKSSGDPRVVYFRHEVNKGVGAGIVNGYKLALRDEMDVVAVMAGDNQMDPAQLPRLLFPILEGEADYTKGNRLLSEDFMVGMSRWRSFGNLLLSLLTKIGSGYWQVMDPQNGYTAISRRALEVLELDSVYPYYGYCNDLLIKLNAFGMRVMDVVIPARYGREKSSIKYSKYILKVSPMLFRGFLWRLRVKYTVLDFHPLVLFYVVGMLALPAGMILGFLIFLQSLLQNPLPSYYTMLDLFMLGMGVQMLLFGMLFDMQAEKKRSESGRIDF